MSYPADRCPRCSARLTSRSGLVLCPECACLLETRGGGFVEAWRDIPRLIDQMVKEEAEELGASDAGKRPVLLGAQFETAMREIEITRLAKRWHASPPFAEAGRHRDVPLGKLVEYDLIGRVLQSPTRRRD